MKNFYIYKSAAIIALIYFLTSISLMFFTYPHEDALILFRYVENFTVGGDIAFNINGENAEGATDFLWFLIMSLLNFLGLNVNFTAILINTISLLFIINLIQKFFFKNENLFYIIILFLTFLNIGPIIGSSLYGFSTIFFIFLGFNCYLSSINKKFISWTIFSILFCLTRPEGVFLFIPTIFIIFSLSSAEDKIRFYKSFFIISITGICYFIWRYFYFDNLLPLPLIIKSIGGESSIRRMAALGIQILNSFLLALILSIIYSFIKNYKKIFEKKNSLTLFILTIVFWIIFLFILSRGFLSQNIFDRYFASFYFLIFITFLYSFIYLKSFEKKIILIVLIISSIYSSNLTMRLLTEDKRYLTNPTYKIFVEYSQTGGWGLHPLIKIGKTLSEKKLTIMLTEAGAIPYLSNKSVIYDMIGLNTKIFTKRPVNCNDIEKISPDIIEIDVGPLNWDNGKPKHLAHFDWSSFKKNENYSECGFHSKFEILENFLDSTDIELIKKFKKTKKDNRYNATIFTVPNNILFCLLKNDKYKRIFNNKAGDQLYFVKSDKNLDYLSDSCNIQKSGYFTDLLKKKL